MLLFHGTTMDRMAWDMVRAEMPAEYEFVMVEFPGSGESSMPVADLTVDVLVEQAIAVMDHLGHDRFHVAGYSLGAVVGAGDCRRRSRTNDHVHLAVRLGDDGRADATSRSTCGGD